MEHSDERKDKKVFVYHSGQGNGGELVGCGQRKRAQVRLIG